MGRFPNNKRFAFSVFDDTDDSTLENVEPVYRFLAELGIYTTKSVWPLSGVPGALIGGATLQDRAYLDFALRLQDQGFEIALHNVQNHDAPREVTQRGFEAFRSLIGRYPRTHCNHYMNRENMYWGADRLNGRLVRFGYNLATRFARNRCFAGHVEDSPYFWGDLCKKHISYVRNFAFREINLDRVNPTMPYHDPRKPFVNEWFSSSEGGTVDSFCAMLCEANQDRLEVDGGVCIMYTHFAKGFLEDGVFQAEFERLMRRLAAKNGWFVPVSKLLDYLKRDRGRSDIPTAELARMERRWFLTKLQRGTS